MFLKHFYFAFISVLQRCYVYLIENLCTENTTVIDELLECDVLTDKEKADFRDINNIKVGSLLKRIIRKGPNVCRKAVSTLEKYDIHCNIQQIIAQQTGMLDKNFFIPSQTKFGGYIGFILSVCLSPICGHDVVNICTLITQYLKMCTWNFHIDWIIFLHFTVFFWFSFFGLLFSKRRDIVLELKRTMI